MEDNSMDWLIKKLFIIITILLIWIATVQVQHGRSAEPENLILAQQRELDRDRSAENLRRMREAIHPPPPPQPIPPPPVQRPTPWYMENQILAAIIGAIGIIIVALIGLLNRRR
jgi:hypothetical protein